MSILNYQGVKYTEGKQHIVEDALVMEEALRISINDTPFTITMRTPDKDEELIRGLLFTEDIYSDKTAHPEIHTQEKNNLGYATSVNVVLDESKITKPYRNSRNILSVSSCGICGKTELETVHAGTKSINHKEIISVDTVWKMFEQMNSRQNTFKQSGGSHAAAAFTLDGKLLTIQEDIGRHNAVDKVIGRLLLDGKLNQARCLTVSGRISYEIVSKCFMAGMPFLAAVSAPSSLAVDFSKELGITLMAFCREGNFTVYSNSEKCKMNEVNIERRLL